MKSVIQALVVTTVIQIVAMFGMTAYSAEQARFYASVAESNSRLAAAELVLHHRNEVQQQFADEREQMKLYVDRAVDRKINQTQHTGVKQ